MFRDDARRYECGSNNFLGIVGLRESLRLVQEIGVPAIAADLIRKRQWLVPAIQALGYEVICAVTPAENTSGIVSFHKTNADLPALHHKIAQAGVHVSLRQIPGGQPVLRLAPHFYNTDAELRRVLELLADEWEKMKHALAAEESQRKSVVPNVAVDKRPDAQEAAAIIKSERCLRSRMTLIRSESEFEFESSPDDAKEGGREC